MEGESQRIDELRRRVQQDPASIAFAHLADEHRRAGDLQEAVRVCRAGLEHHPGYLLAHVTLGRALMELEQYPEARTELEYVLRVAPDNLVALKSMEELQHREEPAPHVAAVARTPLKLRPSTEDPSPDKNAPLVASPPDAPVAAPPEAPITAPPVAQVVSPLDAPVAAPPEAPIAAPPVAQVVSPPDAPVAAPPETQIAAPPVAQVVSPQEAQSAAPPEAVDPALEELEGWLAALNAARGDRR